MAYGCLFDLLVLGPLLCLFKKSDQKRNRQLDRVETGTHQWIGMSGKTRYNRRYLGPIQQKTFLSSSRMMVKTVDEFENVLCKLLPEKEEEELEGFDIDYNVSNLLKLHLKIQKYMRQIDRRATLRCYAEWKSQQPASFSAYQQARTKAIKLGSKLKEASRRYNFIVGD